MTGDHRQRSGQQPRPKDPAHLQVRQSVLERAHARSRPTGFASPEIAVHGNPVPIWFAALLATNCQAKGKDAGRDINWNCVSGRALYTNRGAEEEVIEPLGVCLQVGQTIAVSWTPGDTTYTVEVFRQLNCVA